MLFSCKNDLKKSTQLFLPDTLPPQLAKDIEVTYSERGKVQAVLTAPLMVKTEGEDPVLEFPMGFYVVFYDGQKRIKSSIAAQYGINHEKEEIIEARDSVVVYNREKDQTVYTDHLTWERKEKFIYSYEEVKIVTTEDVIIGDTLLADENFENYTLKNISAEISVEDENVSE